MVGLAGNVQTAASQLRQQFPQASYASALKAVTESLDRLNSPGQRISAARAVAIPPESHTQRPDNMENFRYRVDARYIDPATNEPRTIVTYIGSSVPLTPNEIAAEANQLFLFDREESPSFYSFGETFAGPGPQLNPTFTVFAMERKQ